VLQSIVQIDCIKTKAKYRADIRNRMSAFYWAKMSRKFGVDRMAATVEHSKNLVKLRVIKFDMPFFINIYNKILTT